MAKYTAKQIHILHFNTSIITNDELGQLISKNFLRDYLDTIFRADYGAQQVDDIETAANVSKEICAHLPDLFLAFETLDH